MWWTDSGAPGFVGRISDSDLAELLPATKEHLRLEANETEQDDYVSRLLRSAVGHVESITGTPFTDREAVIWTNAWSAFEHLPVGPVSAITSIEFTPAGLTAAEVLPTDGYDLRRRSVNASIVPTPGRRWPTILPGSAIKVELEIGYGDDRPDDLWLAAQLLVAQWFRNRSAVNVGNIVNEMPNGVYALLANHRRF